MEAQRPPRDGEHRVYVKDGTLSGVEHYIAGMKNGLRSTTTATAPSVAVDKHPQRGA